VGIDIKKYLNIPQECFVGKKVFKKLFYENYKFKSAEKKFFTDDIDEINWIYSVKPENSNITSFIDEEREYEEVAFIEIILNKDSRADKIAEIIHSSIPYPIFLIITSNEKVLLSLAQKRINQVDKSKSVVEKVLNTDWIENESDVEISKFLRLINFKSLPMENLFKFYSAFFELVVDLDCFRKLGKSNNKLSSDKKILVMETIERHEGRIEKLKKELADEEHIGRKVEINVEIRNIQTLLEEERKKI
jgi:hypothetical protein